MITSSGSMLQSPTLCLPLPKFGLSLGILPEVIQEKALPKLG